MASVPVLSTSPGYPGMIATDGVYLYLCTSVNTWKRVAISTF
jgi:hypothetical protein